MVQTMQPQTVESMGSDARFHQLQCALAQGWQIEAPVYWRAQWFTQSKQGYYFILKRGREVDLVVVSESPALRQWIKAQRLKVIAA